MAFSKRHMTSLMDKSLVSYRYLCAVVHLRIWVAGMSPAKPATPRTKRITKLLKRDPIAGDEVEDDDDEPSSEKSSSDAAQHSNDGEEEDAIRITPKKRRALPARQRTPISSPAKKIIASSPHATRASIPPLPSATSSPVKKKIPKPEVIDLNAMDDETEPCSVRKSKVAEEESSDPFAFSSPKRKSITCVLPPESSRTPMALLPKPVHRNKKTQIEYSYPYSLLFIFLASFCKLRVSISTYRRTTSTLLVGGSSVRMAVFAQGVCQSGV